MLFRSSHAVVMLNGDTSVSASEVGLAVKRLGSMINNTGVDIEYGVSYSGSSALQVSLLASGFTWTKYDDYDPLRKVLGDRQLEEGADSFLSDGLSLLQPCD